MARSGVCGCGRGQEHEVAFGEVGDGVENRGFRAVEACSAQHVDDGWSQQRAVEVVGLCRHGLLRDGGSRLGVWCFYRNIMARCRISVARRESVDVKVVVTLFVTRTTLPESEDRSRARIKSGAREGPEPLLFVNSQTSLSITHGSEVFDKL